ncbi:MAG TPA: tryptophan synthase subunit alpha [Polyangia bacterium]|nr:tryptophan synthase subunit alpha [Polyangia bacterium]
MSGLSNSGTLGGSPNPSATDSARQSPALSTRLTQIFARAKAAKRAALVIYLTAQDPDDETSRRLVLAAAEAGADIIEVGVPWSDPSADGKAIQAAIHRALASGGGMSKALALTRALRQAHPDVGIVLFGYANPIVVMGHEAFAAAAHDAGADGVLCVDYPADEDAELTTALAKYGMDFVPLLAPTSTAARIDVGVKAATGFIYYVSLTGITGTALADMEEPRAKVEAIRARSGGKLPVAVGFGIKTPGAARAVASFADGVVVGSAAVEVIEKAVAAKRDPVPDLAAFVRSLRDALDAR